MDITGDGIRDVVTGSYYGGIYLYRGIKGGGFEPIQEIEQYYDRTIRDNYNHVVYTNPSFADFNDDGLLDAIYGGHLGMRVMLNIGTKEQPKFAKYEPLMSVNGEQVSLFGTQKIGEKAVDSKAFITLIDWDNDGVKDLITTCSNIYQRERPILFHKGVMGDNGLVFELGVPIIKPQDYIKLIPGEYLIHHICDYNNDNKLDILIGVRMDYNTVTEGFNQDAEEFYMFNIVREEREAEISAVYDKYLKQFGSFKSMTNEQRLEMNAETANINAKYKTLIPISPTDYRFPDYKNYKGRGLIIVFEGV